MTLNRATEAAGVSEDELLKGTPDVFRRKDSNRTTPEESEARRAPIYTTVKVTIQIPKFGSKTLLVAHRLDVQFYLLCE